MTCSVEVSPPPASTISTPFAFTDSQSSKRPLKVPTTCPKCWGKNSQLTTKVTLMSHQQVWLWHVVLRCLHHMQVQSPPYLYSHSSKGHEARVQALCPCAFLLPCILGVGIVVTCGEDNIWHDEHYWYWSRAWGHEGMRAQGHEGMRVQGCKGANLVSSSFSLPTTYQCKKFKQVWLWYVVLRCPHHLQVQYPPHLHSQSSKRPL